MCVHLALVCCCRFYAKILYSEVFLTLTEVFPCFFLCCKANAWVKFTKTGHGPHSSTLVVICVVRLLFVLFYVLFVCICVLPPGDIPIAVNKYIIYISAFPDLFKSYCFWCWHQEILKFSTLVNKHFQHICFSYDHGWHIPRVFPSGERCYHWCLGGYVGGSTQHERSARVRCYNTRWQQGQSAGDRRLDSTTQQSWGTGLFHVSYMPVVLSGQGISSLA